MAGSGIFPKVDGDILYSYDVNMCSRNLLKGIIPTVLGWTTQPTGLGSITDNNYKTFTSVGVLSGLVSGTLTFDMGGDFTPFMINYIGSGVAVRETAGRAIDIRLFFSGPNSSGFEELGFIGSINSGT